MREAPGDSGTAAARFHQALALADALGMRPLIARCHLAVRRLYRRTDEPRHAQEHLTTAGAMYGEMGMTFWLQKLDEDA